MDARRRTHRGRRPALTAALVVACALGSAPALAQVSGLGTEITVPPLPLQEGDEGSSPQSTTTTTPTTTTAPPPPTTVPTPTTAATPADVTAPAGESTKPATATGTETARRSTPAAPRRASSTPSAGETVDVAPAVAQDKPAITRLRQVSLPAARQFGFPLALAGLVLLFLAVQGRLDARDPKLAAAPLSIDDDLLPFA